MQEEVEQRIVSLMISCGKLGEQEFRKAVAKLLEQLKNDHQKHQHSKANPHGKMTVKQLAAKDKGLQSIEVTDQNNPLSLKSDFILSLCELIVGGKDGLAPVEKTIIDRCVRIVYRDYLNDPKPENMPLLEDLYNALRAQDEKEAQYIATALEIYVTGSLNVFNHHTNVDVNSRIVCYDIKELGKQLKKIGMLVVQDQVWNRVTINRAAHKTTRYYIEQYFRIRNIRFIAVNENFDTAAPEDAHSGIIIPLRNMINEAYALDIGRKIRAQQRQAMKDGKFIGARTPYGYLKAEDDCHQLIIDPVAAIVVQRMFRWASEGAGLNTIAVRLNEAGVLTPSHYKKMQGKITHENLLGSGKWQTRTVGVILRSEVYTGDLVQGQTKTVDHRQVKADAEEWTVVRNTHEAIISREQFAAVQEILNQTASRAKARDVKAYTPNLLKGKVFCVHCGGSLHRQRNIRKKSDDVYLYYCLSRSRTSKDACPGVTIREDALLDMLADMLQEALNTALGEYRLSLAELPRQAADRAELREKITSRKQEIQRLRGIVRSLYENLVQGVLTKDEYFDYKEKYENRIADLAAEMEQLEDGLRTIDTQIEQHRALERDAAQIKADRALTGALIGRLIDRIEVSHGKQITVHYRFQSEFETYVEVLEQCRNM